MVSLSANSLFDRSRTTSDHLICLTHRPLSQTSSRSRIRSRSRPRKRSHHRSNLRGRKRVRYLSPKADLTEQPFWFCRLFCSFAFIICEIKHFRWMKFETQRRGERRGNNLEETLRPLRLCVSTFAILYSSKRVISLHGSPSCLIKTPKNTSSRRKQVHFGGVGKWMHLLAQRACTLARRACTWFLSQPLNSGMNQF